MFKNFLGTTIVVAAALGLLSGMVCEARAKTVLNLDFLSSEGSAEHAAAIFVKSYVEKQTNGELQIDIYPGAQLCGNPNECYQALLSETVHIYPDSAGGTSLIYPPVAALDIPYSVPGDIVARSLLYDGNFENQLRRLILDYTKGQFLVLGLSQTAGWRCYANTKREARTPADLRGMKLRTVENQVQMEQVRLHGASPTPIPFMEVYDSLSKGVVDGTLNSITDLVAVKLHEKAKYLTEDQHTFMFIMWYMSDAFFKKLPPAQQKALIDGFRLASIVGDGMQMHLEVPSTRTMLDSGGKIYVPTAEEKKQFVEAVRPLRDWYLKEYGEEGKKFLDLLDACIARGNKENEARMASFTN